MYIPSQNWLEQIKNVVTEMINKKSFVLEGTVTSVSKSTPYKVKVMLEPYEIETGWIPVATPYAGNGFGVILPPPDEGTQVKVIFELGDINQGSVICSTYNDQIKQPNTPFGAAGIIHKSGAQILINPDGSIQISAAGGKRVTITGQTSQSW